MKPLFGWASNLGLSSPVQHMRRRCATGRLPHKNYIYIWRCNHNSQTHLTVIWKRLSQHDCTQPENFTRLRSAWLASCCKQHNKRMNNNSCDRSSCCTRHSKLFAYSARPTVLWWWAIAGITLPGGAAAPPAPPGSANDPSIYLLQAVIILALSCSTFEHHDSYAIYYASDLASYYLHFAFTYVYLIEWPTFLKSHMQM